MNDKIFEELKEIIRTSSLLDVISLDWPKEKIIEEFNDRLYEKLYGSWQRVSWDRALSEDFIREFKDRVNWPWISIHQNLSENFIREFKDFVSWEYIFRFQKLSAEFIEEFIDKFITYINQEYENIINT